ncbi:MULTISPECIES: zinc-binding dehydrogenase [Micromonospora]|uniref:NADPH:quinone reductase n=1 Tax=Micromonospora sicca TaxID=2202420 RepID=A0A317D766_9ACTN|nr:MULTISPECIES: zinc-binding dehydrogenase [unclassified Micromonospora]MBM0228676.1 zinc-binding dehydrogenase [Micromonospora sp. ATA51]PWR09980.1 NADPH:quinone reductase [Micromonospora sp. 4G51]
MRAIQVAVFGGPEVLSPAELPDPAPGPGQVVVGMAAADVILLDTLLRSGWGQDFFPRMLPYVPGGGGAGAVVETGEGVDPAWIGRRVVVRTSTGYAERVVAHVEEIMPVPDGLAIEAAAALVHDGVTALSLDRLGTPEKGEWVLVSAAAGGAGSLLVQLAADAGARVVAAASSDVKLALARELGAEVAVDYTRSDWIRRVREATGGGAALVYDGAGGPLGAAALDAVADGGRFVTYGTADGFAAPDPESAARRGIRVLAPLLDGPPNQKTVRELLGLALERAAEGRLRPAIGATYPLEQATDAHRALAARTTVGKSLLLIGGQTAS